MIKLTRTAAVLRVTAALVLALTLSACGDISEDGSGTPAAVASTTSTTSSATSSTSTGAATPAPAVAAATDPSAAVEFTAENYSAAQQAGSVTLTVSRVGTSTAPASVNYSTADGTASAGAEYESAHGTLSWAENDSTLRTISVPINTAAALTGTKSFTVSLVNPSAQASVGNPGSATVTINGTTPSAAGSLKLSSPAYAVTTASAGSAMTVTVNRTGGSSGAVSVAYGTADGSAAAGRDYTASSGVLEWADGDAAAKSFTVPTNNSSFTGTRQFEVALSNPRSGVALATPASATATIAGTGNGSPGTFTLAASSYSVTEGTRSITVSVQRLSGSAGAASVAIRTYPYTATAGVDFSGELTYLNWANGDTTPKTLTIPLLSPAAYTGTRMFAVALMAPSAGAKVGSPAYSAITISGSGSAAVGQISLSSSSYSVAQSAGLVKLTVNRTGGSHGTVSVSYAEIAKTAVSGADFTAGSGTIAWADGDASPKTLTVNFSSAAPFAGTKSFNVVLSNATGGAALATPNTATVSVLGDAQAAVGNLQLSASAYTVPQAAGSVYITVNRTGGSSGAISVNYGEANGGAFAGTDFTSTSGTLNWADGDATSKSFSIPISDSKPFTGLKAFGVALANPTGGAYLVNPVNASVTINGAAAGAPIGAVALSNTAYTVAQTAGSLVVNVNRTGGSSGAVGVSYSTSNGTAVAGKDYTAAAGSLQWANGDTSTKQFTVPVASSTSFSGTKSFNVALAAPVGGASVGNPAAATATIDGMGAAAVGTIGLASSTYSVAQNSGTVPVIVNRANGSSGAVSVNVSTSNGSAVAGTDFTGGSGTLQWADGDGAPKTLPIPISNATPFSGTKSFTVNLSGQAGGASLGTSTSTVTITGDAVAASAPSGPSSPPVQTGSVFWVYHNGQFNWAGDFSFDATINYKDTAGGPIDGPYDIAVSITSSYGAFQPWASGGQFDTTPYKYLIYSVKSTVPNQTYATIFDADNDVKDGGAVNAVGAYGPTPVVGQWETYKIPLSAFGFTNPSILKFTIADSTGNPTNKFYVDDVGFSAN